MNEENKIIWKDIPGYEGLYKVSNTGKIFSCVTNRELSVIQKKDGYTCISLCDKDHNKKQYRIHQLVAKAFIPNPNNLGTVNHKDEVKTNNTVSNLEWMSIKDNNNYGTRNKRLSETQINDKNKSKEVQMFDKSTGELLDTFPSLMEAGRVTGINQGNISKCCLGKRKSSGGYVWKYF